MKTNTAVKVLVIDGMINLRKQMIAAQEALNLYDGYRAESPVLFHSTDDFFEFALYVNAPIQLKGYTSSKRLAVGFTYKDTFFETFMKKEEYELYKHLVEKNGQMVQEGADDAADSSRE